MSIWDTLEKIPDPLYEFGGGVLSGIGGLLAGKSEQEKFQEWSIGKRKSLIQRLMSRGLYGRGDISNIRGTIEQGNIPYLNKLAMALSRKGLLKGGAGLGEMLRAGQSGVSQQMVPFLMDEPRQRLSLTERLLG